jgi:Lamin Tail Domain
MKKMKSLQKLLLGLAALLMASVAPVHADIIISEVAPYASGNTVYAADWFELTNTGSSAVNITGWKMDDNSNSFAAAVALRGVTSINPGQSVIFIESNASGSTDSTIDSSFKSAWFGSNVPAGLLIGNYGGSGVGLSTSSDAVNIFNSSGSLMANVSFNASTTGKTFDNAAGLNNATLTQLSAVGVNGAKVDRGSLS